MGEPSYWAYAEAILVIVLGEKIRETMWNSWRITAKTSTEHGIKIPEWVTRPCLLYGIKAEWRKGSKAIKTEKNDSPETIERKDQGGGCRWGRVWGGGGGFWEG